jgi:hypothetical protein
MWNKILNFLDTIRQDQTRLPVLDPSMPNYNFRSYLECCESLKVKPSVTKFVKYNQYWINNFNEKKR